MTKCPMQIWRALSKGSLSQTNWPRNCSSCPSALDSVACRSWEDKEDLWDQVKVLVHKVDSTVDNNSNNILNNRTISRISLPKNNTNSINNNSRITIIKINSHNKINKLVIKTNNKTEVLHPNSKSNLNNNNNSTLIKTSNNNKISNISKSIIEKNKKILALSTRQRLPLLRLLRKLQ